MDEFLLLWPHFEACSGASLVLVSIESRGQIMIYQGAGTLIPEF
jgi:hypothetical protein